jgi:hypothetical protein
MFNSFSFTILNILIFGVVLISYGKMVFGEIKEDIFYFNGALMFGALTSTLCYFTAIFLQKANMELMQMMFGVHNWTNMVTNLAFGYSIWKLSRSYSTAR